jgi:hypothetical protein
MTSFRESATENEANSSFGAFPDQGDGLESRARRSWERERPAKGDDVDAMCEIKSPSCWLRSNALIVPLQAAYRSAFAMAFVGWVAPVAPNASSPGCDIGDLGSVIGD